MDELLNCDETIHWQSYYRVLMLPSKHQKCIVINIINEITSFNKIKHVTIKHVK